MMRARPGAPGPRKRGHAAEGKGKAGRTLRNVPPPPPRRGVNSQKSEKVRSDRTRARRTGLLRRVFNFMRTVVLIAVVTGGLGAGGWAGWQAYENHGLLALRQVDVVGNKLVAKTDILEKAGLELGTKLPSIPVAAIEASLRSMPGIGDVDIRRIYPSRIEIRVKEKEPVAMGYARGWYGLAIDGSRIAGLDWGQSDLPVVDGFAALDSSARAALGGFLEGAKRAYPALYANFSQLSLRGNDGLEIILRDGRMKVLVGLERPARLAAMAANPLIGLEKATTEAGNKSLNSLEFLQALIDQQGASIADGKTVDLRVYGYAYVR